MITRLSRDKEDSLVRHLKRILLDHLGNAISEKPIENPTSTARIPGDDRVFYVLTTLKEVFLELLLFVDDIVNDFQNEYSKVAKGENFTYSLAKLRATFARKKRHVHHDRVS